MVRAAVWFGLALSVAASPAAAQQVFNGSQTTPNGSVNGGGGVWDASTTNWTNFSGTSSAAYVLGHMKAKGKKKVEVALRAEDHNMPILPWIDPENFNPGYIMRNMNLLPKRGDKPEWQHSQDYWTEKDEIPKTDLDDKAFVYG